MAAPTLQVLATLARFGILLKQDKRLPNVVTLVTGEVLSTSWWSHPKGRLVFAVLAQLSDHPDVLFTKLLYTKDTLVHRSLWPALLAVATAGEPWQRRGLSPGARSLLQRVARSAMPVQSSGAAVKELASRLLVHAVETHTETGRHEMAVESWSAWAGQVGITTVASVSQARQVFEQACQLIGAPVSALPWPSAGSGAG